MPGFAIGPPFPRLARLASAGQLPPSLLLTGGAGAPTMEAALALSAVVNSPAGPDSGETAELHERIRRTDEVFQAGGGAANRTDGWTGPGPGPYPDIRVVRPADGKPIPVDAVREAIASVRTRPFEGRRRILVIQDADTMRREAANTLLKTLEEPHPWLGLILCARNEAALLPTIVSRCQRWRFPAPTAPELATRLRREHGYSADEARIAAAAAGGDLERALTLPRDRLAALAEEAERMAAVVVRGIVPAARDALTARLVRRVSGARKPEGYDELEFILILLRTTLRDLAAIRSGTEALYGDPQGLREDAALAPAGEFAKAMLAAEETHRILFEQNGNRRMQLDALLLGFNEIARPLVLARRRAKRAGR